VLQDREVPELKPMERVTVSGYYHLLNIFGTPTGERAFVERGDLVPSAPRAHRWRLKDPIEDKRVTGTMR
jgi:hypothetical protein